MRPSSLLMILLILGIAVRLATAWGRPSDLTLDNDGYLAHAELVKNGEGFAGPYTHRPTAFRPPAYPIVLAGLRWLGLSPPVSVLIINGLSSIAVIWCIWILSRQLQLTPLFSCLATAIAAFDPLLLRYTVLPMTEVPAAAMLISAVVALKAAEQPPEMSNRCVVGFRILAGVLFGLGSLVRPILLVSCAMLILWRLMLSWKCSSGIRKNFVITVLPMIAAVLAISPWVVRNAVQFGKIIPATTHGGYTLALGNNPDFYRDVIDGHTGFPWPGPQLEAWQQRMIADAAAQGVPAGDEPAQDAWYYEQAIASMKAQPLSFLKSCLLRLRRFWAITPGTNDNLPPFLTTLVAVWYVLIGTGLVAAIWNTVLRCLISSAGMNRAFERCLTVGGLRHRQGAHADGVEVKPVEVNRTQYNLSSLCRRKDIPTRPGLADLWLVVLSFMLLHSVYWTDARMRVPVIPLIAILAAVGWESLLHSAFRFVAGRQFTCDTHSESPASPESPT